MNTRFYKKTLELDLLLNLQKITSYELNKLQKLIDDKSLAIYFFNKLDNNHWFTKLYNSKILLSILNMPISDEDNIRGLQLNVCNYLENVANDFQDEIVYLILNTNSKNSRLYWKYIRIGNLLDPKNTAKLIPAFEKWIRNKKLDYDIVVSEISQWFNHLVSGSEIKAALKLLKIISTPKKQKPVNIRSKEIEKVIGKERPTAVPVMEYYWMKEVFTEGIKNLIKQKPFKSAKILQKSLEKAIKIEFGYKAKHDLSYIWRAAIEEHQQNYDLNDYKEILLVALRNSLEAAVKSDEEKGSIIIESFLNHQYSIFNRLALHLIRISDKTYLSIAKNLIQKKSYFKDEILYHEFYIMLSDLYPQFSENEKKKIYDNILSIKSYDKLAASDLKTKQMKYKWWERLNFISKHLIGKERKFFNKLNEEFRNDKFRDTSVWHESSMGVKSPLSVEELESKSNEEVFKLIREFKRTSKGIDAESEEGLARTFSQLFRKAPERFIENDLSVFLEFRPEYNYWIVDSITQIWSGLDDEQRQKILQFLNRLMRIEDIPAKFTSEFRINFTQVKSRILEVVSQAIKTQRNKKNDKLKDDIWNIIFYLSYYKYSPDDDPFNYKTKMEPVTLALNSVRGKAMHALIDFSLWHASLNVDKYKDVQHPNRFEGEERVLELLEDKLNKNPDENGDTSLAVHSAFGQFLPNFTYLNREWVLKNIDRIFPGSEPYWMSAWGAYINASRFYTDLFELLKPQFIRALNYIANGYSIIPSGFGRTPEEALSEHLVIASLQGLDDIFKKNSLLRNLVTISDNKIITHAIQFIYNLAKDQQIFNIYPNFWKQTKKLWELRIKIAKKIHRKEVGSQKDEIDTEFSRYLYWLEHLPKEVTLDELEPLLIETIKLNKRGWHLPKFIEYLSNKANDYPVISMNLLYYLTNTDAPSHFFHGKEKEIERILNNAINSKNDKVIRLADKFINFMGERGNYYFKDLWENSFLDSFNVNNITNGDIKKKQIRILKKNKKYFPKEIIGSPRQYKIQILFNDKLFDCMYKIGSQDRKSRSGVLSFNDTDYEEIISSENKKLKFLVFKKNKVFKLKYDQN